MYSYQRASIFSMMIVPSLASMHVVAPLPHFPPVAKPIYVCMRLVLFSASSCSLSWHCTVSRFCFAYIHSWLISLSSNLYSAPFLLASRLWSILRSIVSVIDLCLAVFSTSGKTLSEHLQILRINPPYYQLLLCVLRYADYSTSDIHCLFNSTSLIVTFCLFWSSVMFSASPSY